MDNGRGGRPPSARLLDRVPAEVRGLSTRGLREAVDAGLCVGKADRDRDDWFPVQERATDTLRAYARRVCRGCEVRLACLELAVRTGESHGIWGGLIGEDLARIRADRTNRALRAERLAEPAEPAPRKPKLARTG